MKNITADLLLETTKKVSSGFKQISQCASDLKKEVETISWLSGGKINTQIQEDLVVISGQKTELNSVGHH